MVSDTLQLAEPRQETTSFASLDQRNYQTGFHTFTTLCTYPEFVQAATGHPPSFGDNRRKNNGQNTDSGNNEKSGSDDDTDSQKGNSDHEKLNDDFNDNDYAPQWHIIPEIGDGACSLRCVSRIHNTSDMHEFIRAVF